MIDLIEFASTYLSTLYGSGKRTTVMWQEECVFEEAGEAVAAFRRWQGGARRSGTLADVAAELADVQISAHVLAVGLTGPWFPLPHFTTATTRPSLDTFATLLPASYTTADATTLARLLGEAAGRVMSYSLDDNRAAQLYELARLCHIAAGMARVLGIDNDLAVKEKTALVMSRGFGNQADITSNRGVDRVLGLAE